MYVDVALEGGTFTYRVPKKISSIIKIGSLVKVHLKNTESQGWIINIKHQTSNIKNIKDVLAVAYHEPLITDELIELGKWMGEYYQASLGSVLNLMVPVVKNIRISQYQNMRGKESKSQVVKLRRKRHVPLVISDAIKKNEFKSILVYGGQRQQIYMEAIEETLAQGRGSILLVPEIELTTPIFSLLQKRFPGLVALLHSGLKKEERWLEWCRIKDGVAPIVVGTMSAVFAPVPKLGLIIVDEEQDPAYKSEKHPRYSTPVVAEMRAKLCSAVYLPGSNTPSIETFYITSNKIKLTHPHKPANVMVVDMRNESDRIFSVLLRAKLATYIKRHEKILLFLNRKGFSSFILCEDCGYVPRCKRCDIPLTYHINYPGIGIQDSQKPSIDYKLPILRCHYCGYIEQAPSFCPNCKGFKFIRREIGTTQVERYFTKLFPGVKILRLDLDNVSTYTRLPLIFKAFERGEFQVILGTMLAVKPALLPRIGLVGVISADFLFGRNLPDFRYAEHSFSLLMRLVECSNEVVLQTYNPGDRVFKYLRTHDYTGFYKSELLLRKAYRYPPYSHLVRLVIEAKKEAIAQAKASKIKEELEKLGIDFLGPSECQLQSKGKKQLTKLHFLLKVKTPQELPLLPKDIIIDVDPIEFT